MVSEYMIELMKKRITILGLIFIVFLCIQPTNAFGISNCLYRGTIQNGSTANYPMELFLTWGEPSRNLSVVVTERTGETMTGSAVSWITVDKPTLTLTNPDNILFDKTWRYVIGTKVPEKATIRVPAGTAPGIYKAKIFYQVMGINGMVQWGIDAPVTVTVT
jgi:hypothetical protein